MTGAYAYYRLPHQRCYTTVEGSVREYDSCKRLNGQKGFVIAPFETSAEYPIVVITPESVSERELPATEETAYEPMDAEPVTEAYHDDFQLFHEQLRSGRFRKIVLARCSDTAMPQGVRPQDLFFQACALYPRLFIALVSTPQSGIWLTATPEILLEGGGHWRTIALAGTMKLTPQQLQGEGETVSWSTKNIQEQRLVASYIADCLERYAADVSEEGPRTVRAANLVHLRSDFTFVLPDHGHLGDLLSQLHPTPAVCGLPKNETLQFIVDNEHTPRRYYSGFMGMLDPEGDTHLYVSLRCMHIEGTVSHLYAGGGLLPDSVETQEWQETEAKLETMRRCIATRRT